MPWSTTFRTLLEKLQKSKKTRFANTFEASRKPLIHDSVKNSQLTVNTCTFRAIAGLAGVLQGSEKAKTKLHLVQCQRNDSAKRNGVD